MMPNASMAITSYYATGSCTETRFYDAKCLDGDNIILCYRQLYGNAFLWYRMVLPSMAMTSNRTGVSSGTCLRSR
jgi:hypothetical protein